MRATRHCFQVLFLAALISGCASTSHEVEPVYAPQGRYASLSCVQLEQLATETDEKIAAVSVRVDTPSAGDRVALGVGMVLWPVLFMVEGNSSARDQLAVLKGQRISIDNERLDRNCPGLQAGTSPLDLTADNKQQVTAPRPEWPSPL